MNKAILLAACAALAACAPQSGQASGSAAAATSTAAAAAAAQPAMTPAASPAGQPAPLAAQGSPESFVRSLYARYAATAATQDPSGPEWSDQNVYAPSLIALIERDRQLANGEVGFVNADPICQCQDTEGVRLVEVISTPAGADRADARVKFTFGGERDVEMTIKLLQTPNGWRVEDVLEPEGGSFAEQIRRANAEAERAAGSGSGAAR